MIDHFFDRLIFIFRRQIPLDHFGCQQRFIRGLSRWLVDFLLLHGNFVAIVAQDPFRDVGYQNAISRVEHDELLAGRVGG